MRNFLVILFIGYSLAGLGQKTSHSNSTLVQKICRTYNKLAKIDETYGKTESDNLEDSINKYNSVLSSMISSQAFGSLDRKDLLELAKLTDIKLCISKDNKIMVVSWIPSMSFPEEQCSNILWIKDGSARRSEIKGKDRDIFDVVQIDTVIDYTINGKSYYLIVGGIRCGNLCILEKAAIFYLSGLNLKSCVNCLSDGQKHYDEIEFEYTLNSEIKEEPGFKFQNNEIISPVFDEQGMKITGEKRYSISIK